MSWFARSIANTLTLNDDDDDDEDAGENQMNKTTDVSKNQKHEEQVNVDNSPLSPGRGVKEDLSEITKTLTRQFWGVASFLAPPLPAEQSNERSESSDPEASAPEAVAGIRRDFAEIGGRFRRGISKLSNNIDVSEITKLASNFLQLDSEDEDYDSVKCDGAVGVTDEVVAFARDIAMHPETWLKFPLPEDEHDHEDFDLSDAQLEHALAVEHLAPRLAALKIELCPRHMSESSFWKIYFVILHPRLEPHAAELLSTTNIVKARASLTHKSKTSSASSSTNSESIPIEVSEKHPIQSKEIQIVDKSVIQEEPHNKSKDEEDDTDDWLKEETPETVTGKTMIPILDGQDVSFSDLDDDDDVPISYKKATYVSDSSTKDWVQLGSDSAKDSDSSTTERGGSRQVSAHNSSDWLDVIDIDVA